ncbi:hypothetical protein DERP_006109 [Dermatophagoides pteronyssinus]|uniref:Uncharacterized protein n=1 Tax=Dermatophagoides pteronyssinus TaxID=6956 RepID=A0ABQ8JSW5_DERPT|nr:hypothetical protein DERP_006109 [Dermatophagoides pteronyssinus]
MADDDVVDEQSFDIRHLSDPASSSSIDGPSVINFGGTSARRRRLRCSSSTDGCSSGAINS